MPVGHPGKNELEQLEQQIHDAAGKIGKQPLAELLKRLANHYQVAADREEKPPPEPVGT